MKNSNKIVFLISLLLSITFCSMANASENTYKSNVGITFVESVDNPDTVDKESDDNTVNQSNLPQTGSTFSPLFMILGILVLTSFLFFVVKKRRNS